MAGGNDQIHHPLKGGRRISGLRNDPQPGMASELDNVVLVVQTNGGRGVSQESPDLRMVGIADDDDLAAILVQLLNDVLSTSNQDTSTVNDLQAATGGFGKDLRALAM